jgi:hypothetical protein
VGTVSEVQKRTLPRAIPGIGPVTATAVIVNIRNGAAFRKRLGDHADLQTLRHSLACCRRETEGHFIFLACAGNLLAVSELPRTEKPPNRKVRLVEAEIEFEEFSI